MSVAASGGGGGAADDDAASLAPSLASTASSNGSEDERETAEEFRKDLEKAGRSLKTDPNAYYMRCTVLDKRLPATRFNVFQTYRRDYDQRRSKAGTEQVRRDLAIKHKHFFESRGIVHEDPFEACRAHNFYGVQSAIAGGFGVNQKDKATGRTLLHEAAAGGDLELVEYLLDCGATETTRTLLGRSTPLHLAAASGVWQVVDMLLLQGIDPNDTNRSYETALHCARTVDVAKALMRAGARADLKDRAGRTPGAAARARGDHAVAGHMRDHSLDVAKAKILKEREEKRKRRQADQRVEEKRKLAALRREEIEKERMRQRMLAQYEQWRNPVSKKERAAQRKAGLQALPESDPRDVMGLGLSFGKARGGGGKKALPAIRG